MSLPDEKISPVPFAQEEMVDHTSESMEQLLDLLPSIARLRLMAFLHFIEQPDTTKATLEIQPTGLLRLTLDTAIAPCRSHQH